MVLGRRQHDLVVRRQANSVGDDVDRLGRILGENDRRGGNGQKTRDVAAGRLVRVRCLF